VIFFAHCRHRPSPFSFRSIIPRGQTRGRAMADRAIYLSSCFPDALLIYRRPCEAKYRYIKSRRSPARPRARHPFSTLWEGRSSARGFRALTNARLSKFDLINRPAARSARLSALPSPKKGARDSRLNYELVGRRAGIKPNGTRPANACTIAA